MLTHVVMFRFADPERDAPRIAGMLKDMDGRIEPLRSLSVGTNVAVSERAWDLALVSSFDDAEGLEAYRVHPVHQAVVEEIGTCATETATVDFHP